MLLLFMTYLFLTFFVHPIYGKLSLVTAEIKGYMMDRKAANLYTGLGGSYCDLCTYSKEACLNQTLVEEGFTITLDIDNILAIFVELVQDDGTLEKHRNDYAARQGVTTKPIATNSVVSQQVLHSLLRTFGHFMKTVVHLKAGVLDWSESPSSINMVFFKRSQGLTSGPHLR